MPNRIVGIDVGFSRSVAVAIDWDDFCSNSALELYDNADFSDLAPDSNGLEKLLSLDGDIYILEPTGSYSRIWADNLAIAGKEIRFIAHEILAAHRKVCGWSDKDDYHDALAIAHYGWQYLRQPRRFNRIKNPDCERMLQLYFTNQRLSEDYVVACNQARNLLHREFPEVSTRSSTVTAKGDAPPLWSFIAGTDISKRQKALLTKLLNNSIGSASPHRDGKFSEELKALANQIIKLELDRHQIKRVFHDWLYNTSDFSWYNQVFDKFCFGVFDRAIILIQIFPFERFLDENLKEIKVLKKRANKSKSGKLPKRRVSYNQFHACLGKAPNQNSSGNKQGTIVKGSSLARKSLYLWANRCIFTERSRTTLRNEVGNYLRDRYHQDKGLATTTELALVKAINNVDGDLIQDLKSKLGNAAGLDSVILNLEQLLKRNKSSLSDKQAKQEAKKVLGNWAKARVCDQAVKLLFKELLTAIRK